MWLARTALAVLSSGYRDHAMCIEEVAAHLRVTRWHLARVLRAATGETFLVHLHRRRVGAACELLVEGDDQLSIKEIAYEVGYISTRELDRQFRKMMDTTPQQYRRRHRPVTLGAGASLPPPPLRPLQQVS